MSKNKKQNEFSFISRLTKNIPVFRSNHILQGPGKDDAAVINVSQGKVIFTTDILVEENHFSFKYYSPLQIGKKVVEANVSDIAVFGGTPTYALCSLVFTAEQKALLPQIQKGINQACQKYRIDLIGGDLSHTTKNMVINLALLANLEFDGFPKNENAQSGDLIVVTGSLGNSGAGLVTLKKQLALPEAIKKQIQKTHLEPHARLAAGQFLISSGKINAMTDVSDGLASDLRKILIPSQKGAEIYPHKIPISNAGQKVMEAINKPRFDAALYAGEDFELLFTIAPEHFPSLQQNYRKKFQDDLTIIGNVIDKSDIFLIDSENKKEKLTKTGYSQTGNNFYAF